MAKSDDDYEVVATDIPTRHKAGIVGGGIVGIIALIVAIVALVMVFVFHNENWSRWIMEDVDVSGKTSVSLTPKNRTLFQIQTGDSDITVTLSGGTVGDLFGVGNTTKSTSGKVLNVTTTAGNVVIYPASARQFVVSNDGIAPFDYAPPLVTTT